MPNHILALETNDRQFDNFDATGGAISCHHDNLDSRFKYIHSSKLYDLNMDWYTVIGIEQLSNFIHVSFYNRCYEDPC